MEKKNLILLSVALLGGITYLILVKRKKREESKSNACGCGS